MKNIPLLFFVMLILLSGCALSPQVVVINPELESSPTGTAGKTAIVRLSIVDARSSVVIGQRGGIYKDTSDISTDERMNTSLVQNVGKVLKSLGYAVVGKEQDANVDLTVKIASLTYVANTEDLLDKIEVKASIQAVCLKGNKQFTGGYNATRKKDFLKAPTMDQNEVIVNEAISVALQAMLKDQELFAFIDG
jgi:uncharacterized lipoprotein